MTHNDSDGIVVFFSVTEPTGPNREFACHSSTISDLAISSNGRRLITASADATLRLWDIQLAGRDFRLSEAFQGPEGERNRLKAHGDVVTSVAFDGNRDDRFVSTSLDSYVRVWDIDEYVSNRERILRSPEDELSAMALPGRHRSPLPESVPDRITLVSARRAAQSTADAEERVIEIDGHVGPVLAAAFSPDGSRVITAGEDQTARAWLVDSGKAAVGPTGKRSTFYEGNVLEEGHVYNVTQLEFLRPAGRYLLTAGFDASLSVWDAAAGGDGFGRQVARIRRLGTSNAFDTSADGKWVLTSYVKKAAGQSKAGYSARLWKAAEVIAGRTEVPHLELPYVHKFAVTSVAISPGGSRLASGDRRGTIVVWDSAGRELVRARNAHLDGVSAMEFLSETEFLSAAFDGRVNRWRVAGEKLEIVRTYELAADYVWRLSLAPDRRRFLTTSFRADRREKDETPLTELLVHAWSVDEAGPEKLLESTIYGENEDQRVGDAYRHSVAWSKNGKHAVVARNGGLTFYNSAQWEVTGDLREERSRVDLAAAAFSPNGRPGTTAIGTFDGRIAHLWELPSANPTRGQHLGSFRHHASVTSVDFSAAGRYAVTGSRSIRVFDAGLMSRQHGQTVLRIQDPHKGPVAWVEFSPGDDLRIASCGGDDRTARVWNWKPDELGDVPPTSLKLNSHDGSRVKQVRWSPDGKSLLVISEGNAGIWNLDEQTDPRELSLPDDFDYELTLLCGAWSPDGRWIALGGKKGEPDNQRAESVAFIWEIPDDNDPRLHCVVPNAEHRAGGITAIAFASDLLLTGGTNGKVLQWLWGDLSDTGDGIPRAEFPFELSSVDLDRDQAHTQGGQVTSIAVSPDGRIATTGADGAVIWSPSEGPEGGEQTI